MTLRKAGTTKNLRKLICAAALLMGFSGAGFVVPAAFGHGNGRGRGQQQFGPPGRGPNGQGPPGQLSRQAFNRGPGGGPGHGNSGGSGPRNAGRPGPGPGPGNGGGPGPGPGNGGGPGPGPGNSGGPAPGPGNSGGPGPGPGNGGGPGPGPGSGFGQGPGNGSGPGPSPGNAGGPGRGNLHGPGRGNGNAQGNGAVNSPLAAVQVAAPAQVAQGLNLSNGNGDGHGNGKGHGNGPGLGNGNADAVTRGPALIATPPAATRNRNAHRGSNAPAPPATAASAAPPAQAPPAQAAAAPSPPAPSPAAPAAAPPSPPAATHAPTTNLGRGVIAHRRADARRSGSSASPTTSSPTAAGTLALNSGRHTGPLSSTLDSAGAGPTASPDLVGALAPGTAALGRGSDSAPGSRTTTRTVRAARRSHRPDGASSLFNPPGTVIEHFINVIPIGVWIALAAALALAAMAGVAAFRSRRRMQIQAGEVAAVTAAALTDPLTGVLNRRGFMEAAERELDRAGRYGHPMALAFVDIRGLKAVNDTEGHLAGDRLLRRVTTLLRDSARTHDVVGRIGGDELAVLLAEQSAAGAAAMTQRVRAHVPAARSSLRLATPWDVTIGTATFPEDGDDLEQLLAAADRRLYEQRGIQLT